jgi:hypothetical protein
MSYFLKTTKNKYNAKSQEYNGEKYDSKGEAGYAQELDWRIKAGEIKSYERQVKIPLIVNGVLICNYYADFIVITKHDAVEIHEYKGMVLPLFQLKWKLLQALKDQLYPDGVELIMIKHQSYKPKKKKS